MKIFSLLLLFLSLITKPTLIGASAIVETLSNQLVVIAQNTPYKKGIVCLQLHILVGSIHEDNYLGCGISHLLEHMLFKSSKGLKVGELARKIRNAGGEINGYTSYERTWFEIIIPKENLELALSLLKTAIFYPIFEEKELIREKSVIKKEMNLREDDVLSYLHRQFFSTFFSVSPYKYPIIGYEPLFDKLTIKDLEEYHKKNYIPNKMILVIVGDINYNEVITKIKKNFCDVNIGREVISYIPKEPRQISPKILTITREDIKFIYSQIGFQVPNFYSEDMYPLDVLSIALTEGRESRLYKKLKENNLVLSVDSFCLTLMHEGVFSIYWACQSGLEDKVKDIIFKELILIGEEGLREEELLSAKAKLKANYLFSLQDLSFIAKDLAINWMYTKDIDFSKRYLQEVEKVTNADIKRVVNKYFKTNITMVSLRPKEEVKKEEGRREVIEESYIKKTTLPNGIKVIYSHADGGVVFINALFRGGLSCENEDINGSFNILSLLLLSGTKNMSKEELQSILEKKGASISTFSENNSFGITLRVLKEDIDVGLGVLADIIKNSVFAQVELEKKKEEVVNAILAREEDIFAKGLDLMKATLWKEHPFRMPKLGSKESVRKITKDSLIEIYKKFCVGENLVISIFGDIPEDLLLDKVCQLFSDIPQGEKITQRMFQEKQEYINNIGYVNKKQVLILLGYKIPGLLDTESFIRGEVLSCVLSGQNSRLYNKIREKLGLAYSVGVVRILGLYEGALIFYAGTTEKNKERCLKILKEEIKKLYKRGISQEELIFAKNNLLGERRIKDNQLSELSFETGLYELYGLGYSFYQEYSKKVEAVTKEDVLSLIRRYIKPNLYAEVILLPKKE